MSYSIAPSGKERHVEGPSEPISWSEYNVYPLPRQCGDCELRTPLTCSRHSPKEGPSHTHSKLHRPQASSSSLLSDKTETPPPYTSNLFLPSSSFRPVRLYPLSNLFSLHTRVTVETQVRPPNLLNSRPALLFCRVPVASSRPRALRQTERELLIPDGDHCRLFRSPGPPIMVP